MRLVVKEDFLNFANSKKVQIIEEFMFDSNEISYTLKNGVTFMAKIENKGLSAYIAIVNRADNEEGFEVVDNFEIALNKSYSHVVESTDLGVSCEFSLEK